MSRCGSLMVEGKRFFLSIALTAMTKTTPLNLFMRLLRFTDQKGSFSLIELMVTVTIISILAALFFSTLKATRAAVDRATCLNGQRVWRLNSMMEELTVGDRRRLVSCWECHPSIP